MLAGSALASTENQCVSCHRVADLPISLGHTFDEWRGSAHGKASVGCDACHGGNAKASDPEKAHAGVLPASDPKSMVNPVRLPQTCGSCHKKELEAFSPTVHAKVLETAGHGPTCSMCHGAMASSLPSPNELDARCETCHKKPVQAKTALAVIANTKIQLSRTKRSLDEIKSDNPKWYASGADRLHDLERNYHAIQLKWHTFAPEEVLKECHEVLQLTKALNEEAQIMKRRGAQ